MDDTIQPLTQDFLLQWKKTLVGSGHVSPQNVGVNYKFYQEGVGEEHVCSLLFQNFSFFPHDEFVILELAITSKFHLYYRDFTSIKRQIFTNRALKLIKDILSGTQGAWNYGRISTEFQPLESMRINLLKLFRVVLLHTSQLSC